MTHQPIRDQRHAGFTLVELLVVITIIGLLVSLLLPAMATAREQATILNCQSRLRGTGVATVAYAADYKNQYAFSFSESGAGPGFGAGTGTQSEIDSTSANDCFMDYVPDVKTLYCPTIYHYYWPTTPNGIYLAYKNWSKGQAIRWGYSKFVGTQGASGVKPLGYYTTVGGVWGDFGNLGRYLNGGVAFGKHPDDPSYIGAYPATYRTIELADLAAVWTYNGGGFNATPKLGPGNAILWGDAQSFGTGFGVTYVTSHNTVWPGPSISHDYHTTVHGLNNVYSDGHAAWARNDNDQGSIITVDDAQAATLVRSARK